MSALDTIFNILKGAHPDAADEDIKSYIESAKASPDQMDSAVAPLTMDKAPDMSLNIPSANDTKSSFDNKVSTNTVTNNGAPDTLGQTPANPSIDHGASRSWDAPPVTPPVDTAASLDNSDEAKAALSVAKPKDTSVGDEQLKAALAPSDSKANDDELKNKNQKLKMTGALSGLAGGIGDAIGNAAIPFGGKGSSGTQQQILDNTNKEVDKNKVEFDDQQKKDPTSDISRHYQKVLNLMLGDHAKTMGVEKMSAAHIAATLPEVEKYMQKELGMKQVAATRDAARSNRELALSEKEDQFNQRRWERFGAAVNPMNAGSRRALGVAATNNMRADRLLATTQNKNITSQDYSNIIADLQGIYKGGVPDKVMLSHGNYPSIQRKAGEIISMLTGSPASVNTPQIKQHLEELTRELKDVDNKVINDNMGFNRVIFDELEKADPQKFQKAMASLSEMTVGVADEPTAATASPGHPQPEHEKPLAQPTIAKPHPQDSEALDWAKTHRDDPRAAKILKANGF